MKTNCLSTSRNGTIVNPHSFAKRSLVVEASKPLFVLQISVSADAKENLLFFEKDSPFETAVAFVRKHGLDPTHIPDLVMHINRQFEQSSSKKGFTSSFNAASPSTTGRSVKSTEVTSF